MNKLIEQINKVINKKGSLKTPAYYIRELFIDIVNYFENKINTLNNHTNDMNKVVKYIPTGVVYAGYSDGPIAIKDIYTDHYILSEDSRCGSFAVLYSTKKITKITIRCANTEYSLDENKLSTKFGNGLYVYRVGLEFVVENIDNIFYGTYSMKVTYIDGDEEFIDNRLVNVDTATVQGKITLNINGVYKNIHVFGNNLTEFSINVINGTNSIETYSENKSGYKFIFLLNNHEIPTEYIKETENDKIICKLVKQ